MTQKTKVLQMNWQVTDILTVKDVSFSFGDKAVLNNVSLEVQKGEIVSILGPSGVG